MSVRLLPAAVAVAAPATRYPLPLPATRYPLPLPRPVPAAYRRRMIVTWVGLVALVILVIVGPAIGDEERSADANVVRVMALGLLIALITGIMAYVAKNGPEAAQSRAAKLMR